MGNDYYRILGVAPDAPQEVIDASYRALSKKFHPDLNPDGEADFKRIQEAYDVLGNAEQRRAYDAWYRTQNTGGASPHRAEAASSSGIHNLPEENPLSQQDYNRIAAELDDVRRQKLRPDDSLGKSHSTFVALGQMARYSEKFRNCYLELSVHDFSDFDNEEWRAYWTDLEAETGFSKELYDRKLRAWCEYLGLIKKWEAARYELSEDAMIRLENDIVFAYEQAFLKPPVDSHYVPPTKLERFQDAMGTAARGMGFGAKILVLAPFAVVGVILLFVFNLVRFLLGFSLLGVAMYWIGVYLFIGFQMLLTHTPFQLIWNANLNANGNGGTSPGLGIFMVVVAALVCLATLSLTISETIQTVRYR